MISKVQKSQIDSFLLKLSGEEKQYLLSKFCIKRKIIETKIDFEKLVLYFNKAFGKSTRICSEKAKTSLNQRIKEGYLKEDIVKVIDNCVNDNFHRENNYKNISLEFLSRPNIFERYASMVHKKPITQVKDAFTNQ